MIDRRLTRANAYSQVMDERTYRYSADNGSDGDAADFVPPGNPSMEADPQQTWELNFSVSL